MRRYWGAIAACALIIGCSVTRTDRLAAVPNLYNEGRNYSEARVPETYRTVTPELLYVTNRSQDLQSNGVPVYVPERSDSMGYGTAQVQFEGADSWPALLAHNGEAMIAHPVRLSVVSMKDKVRFSKTPLDAERRDGLVVVDPVARAEYEGYARQFREAIRAKVRETGTGRILFYVHGFNNDFEDSLVTLANLWHFSGRQSIPMAFSWPAGHKGIFKYFKDREAGEFSVFHLKETLDLLASVPEVTQIDIVAHSRGADVVTAGLRELIIRERARGHRPKDTMKTGTLILAAPDLDVGIVRQRLLSERFSEGFEQVNVYVNPKDQALAYAALLTQGARFGRLDAEDFAPGELASLRRVGLIHFIRVEGVSGVGHSYFRDNPGVMSDIALTLLTRAFPGGTLRPLEFDQENIWTLHPAYPLERLPDLSDRFLESPR